MQINNSYNNRINFAGSTATSQKAGKKAFNWIAKQCDVSNNGSLARGTFVSVASLFMLGGRFFESRSNDERREVLVRDVPGVVVAVYGAPLINAPMAYASTKLSGIPIITMKEGKKSITGASFAHQKQVIDWYSDLRNLKDPLNTFANTIDKNGGNLKKVFHKLELKEKLEDIIPNQNASNKDILTAFKDSKNKDAVKKLEEAVKNISKDNKVLKTARINQALVKLGGIGFTAALLGVFLPRLNIVTTRKKYQGTEVQHNQKPQVKTQPTQDTVQLHNNSSTEKLTPKQKAIFGSFIK